MLVPSSGHLLPLPDGLDPVHAAPLTDAGLTPYHAVRRSLSKLTPGSTAVVIGVGGLGHLAIQILKATTAARVVAVDTRPRGLGPRQDCGADLTVQSGEGGSAGDPRRHDWAWRRRGARPSGSGWHVEPGRCGGQTTW